MTRIEITDTMAGIVTKMSEGNIEAVSVLSQILEKTDEIDPDNFMGGLGVILSLDMSRVYGSRIWMLYNDVCNKNINHTLGLMRAHQLGFLSQEKLDHAIDNYGEGIDIVNLLRQVQERLPDFRMGD